MYLDKLINLKDDILKITSTNIGKIDSFLGEIGNNGIFTRKQFLSVITQKALLNELLKWLIKEDIIIPVTVRCIFCKQEMSYNANTNKCENCNSLIDANDTENIISFRIIHKLNYSQLELNAYKEKNKKLATYSFDLLCDRLNQKKRKHEDGYIIFIDLANSQKLNTENTNLYLNFLELQHMFFREIMKSFLYKYVGIYLKSEADADMLYLDSENECFTFFSQFINKLNNSELYEKMLSIKKIYTNLDIFLKIYIASSPINDFFPIEKETIDFNAMEACTFIKRIEKKAKEKIMKKYPTNNFPFCIISRNKIFANIKFELENIENYKPKCNFWYANYNDFLKIINKGGNNE